MSATTMTRSQRASRHRAEALENRIQENPAAFRMLSGDRPTGALHVGHYFGSLQNRIRLQNAGIELFVVIADYQAITDRVVSPDLPDVVTGLVADYLAIGIDPRRSTIFAHSQVTALNQLLLPFLSLVSVAEIARNPTVKDEVAAAGSSTVSGLMFTYPVHQAADILFCHANLVPVGLDQLPHPRDHPDNRPPVQRAIQPGAALLPRARGSAQRRAAAARHRRPEDEQEPEQLDTPAGHCR
jgi:tryptophanyl-tRNA synthetase